MNARQFATTLRRISARRTRCPGQRVYSTGLESTTLEEVQIDVEAYEDQPKSARMELPEGMQRVLSMKEKRTKFQRLSTPYFRHLNKSNFLPRGPFSRPRFDTDTRQYLATSP